MRFFPFTSFRALAHTLRMTKGEGLAMIFDYKMHELGITESIINIVLDKAKTHQAGKVTQINLVVGELSGFVPECIQFYFDILSQDTIAQEANLAFTPAPVQLHCRNCSTTFHPQDTSWSCPKCHSQSVEIVGGGESYI